MNWLALLLLLLRESRRLSWQRLPSNGRHHASQCLPAILINLANSARDK